MRKMLFFAMLAMAALTTHFAQAGEPQRGGTLSIVIPSDIRSLDATRFNAITDTVLHHIYEPLVGFRDDLTVGPQLAESWDVSADGRIYTFHLRQGTTYHNGDKVVAGDFKWLWDRRMASATSSDTPWLCIPEFNGSRGLKVESVEATDDATIVFQLAAPSTQFLTHLADPVCNAWIASPKNVDAVGQWIDGSAIGSGPFELKEWKKGQYVALGRFANYVPLTQKRDGYSGDRTTYVDEVRFVVIPDKTAAETALFAGQVDIVPSIQSSRVEEIESKGVTISSAPGLSHAAILIQTQDPLLSNVKIRLAMAHAIDLAQIAQVMSNGVAQPNPSGVPEASALFDKSFQDWPAYDLESAKRLLAEAGYKGELIKLQTNKSYTSMYENAVIVQGMLTAIGMNVEIETLDWATQVDNLFAGKFQLMSFGYAPRADPLVIYGAFMGKKSEKPANQWDDPAAFDIYSKALAAGNLEERKTLLQKLHAMMVEQIPMLGLYYPPVLDAASPKVVGYEAWALDKPRAWGVSKAH